MYRMSSIRNVVFTNYSRRFNHVPSIRAPLLASRSLYTESTSNTGRRSSKLKTYTGSAIAISLITLSAYWALSPSKPTPASILDQRRFQPFTIVSKESVSSSSSIYTLRPSCQPTSDPYSHLWARGIWSVEFKQPQLQIARSYTPLPPIDVPGVPGDLRFLIRREQHGEVSTYLDRLRVGAIVDIRGPRVEYEVPEGVREVVFLAGGTGIAPALQAVHTLLEKRAVDAMAMELPSVHIFWANRRREDSAGGRRATKSSWWSWWGNSDVDTEPSDTPNRVVHELQILEKKFEGKVRVSYMIDEEGSFVGKSDVLKVTSHSLKSKAGVEHSGPGAKLLLISGPDGFVDFYAGPRQLENGKLGQGRLGGLLGTLGLKDWTVVKL